MDDSLWEAFINDQYEEEAAVMSLGDGLDEADKELLRELYAPIKITKEDLSRVYTPAETRQLCLRTKVRVNMTRYNCVWDAKQRLDKEGRLANRSQSSFDAMLTKAVNEKMVYPYTSEEIAESNYIKQCELQKENNRRLNVWHSENTQTFNEESSSTDCLPTNIENDYMSEVASIQSPTTSLDSEPQVWSVSDSQSESMDTDSNPFLSEDDWDLSSPILSSESYVDHDYESQPISTAGLDKSPPQVPVSDSHNSLNIPVDVILTQTWLDLLYEESINRYEIHP